MLPKRPKAPDPDSGRTRAIGSTSAGRPTGPVIGASTLASASIAPAPRKAPTTARIATRKGMIRTATLNPSFAPSTNASYTFTPLTQP